MANITESDIITALHDAGVRPSAQRIAILSYVGNSRLHPSAEEIYCHLRPSLPSLSRTTVYNSLHILSEKRLIREIEIEPGTMRYDLSAFQPHAHFKCRLCSRIIDIPMDTDRSIVPPDYTVDAVDIYYKGICPECNKEHK